MTLKRGAGVAANPGSTGTRRQAARPRHVAVIDIGKTSAKVAMVELSQHRECEVLSTPNTMRDEPPYPHVDVVMLEDFVCKALADLHRRWAIEAITVTTHGATVALIDGDGELALPILDYEYDGPERLADAYTALRPPFADSGSPRLPVGLNVGAQLYWQFATFARDARQATTLLTYPQYWVFRLCGVRCNEVTSLGCHTDLWQPTADKPSTLATQQGWARLLPPNRLPGEPAGTLTAQMARRTSLPEHTPIHVGIHDSNASLVEHLINREQPFSVLSTGTWVIAMAIGGRVVPLDEARDTLLNVNAFGEPVPSSRFMGGRERELLLSAFSTTARPQPADLEAALADTLKRGAMLLPSVVPGCGPFPLMTGRWTVPEDTLTPTIRSIVVDLYLALMCSECLSMIGAAGPTIIEGPFAANDVFRTMLATATGRPTEASADQATGTAVGAARLLGLDAETRLRLGKQRRCHYRVNGELGDREAKPASKTALLEGYAAAWKRKVRATSGHART